MSRESVLMRAVRRLRCSESGSALVEVALTFPVFVALLLGAVELGDLAFKGDEMTNAARSAAQYGAINGGGYTDCAGAVPSSTTPTTCSATRGMYITAQKDAPMVKQSCTSFTVKALSSCICSNASACASSSTAGYSCAASRPVITVSVFTSAQCSPAAAVPNLFPIGTAFTINGFAQQEVTN